MIHQLVAMPVAVLQLEAQMVVRIHQIIVLVVQQVLANITRSKVVTLFGASQTNMALV